MNLKKILPVVRKPFERIRINKQIEKAVARTEEQKNAFESAQLELVNRPVMISEKAQKAVDAVNKMRNRALQGYAGAESEKPFTLALKTKNGDTVEIWRAKEESPNLHLMFLDKNGKKREEMQVATREHIFSDIPEFLRQSWDCLKGQVHEYKCYRNDVMRVTDGLNRSRWRTMSFEETVNKRPVVLKRINSLLENLGEEVKHG